MRNFIGALLACSAAMSVIILIYIAITPLLAKRYHVKWRYYTWLIIVIGLLIPFRPNFSKAPVRVTMPGEKVAPMVPSGNGTPVTVPDIAAGHLHISPGALWWQAAAAVWLAGLLLFLVYHAWNHYRFIKMAGRWNESITDEQALALLQSLKAEMGISKQIGFYLCSIVSSPMMLGFANPRILLPKADLTPDELRFILKHELVHYKRRDLWYKFLVLASTALHWFNPVVYLMAKAIDMQCELSCDAAVVRNTSAMIRRQYSETIIGVVKYRSKLKTALSTNYSGGKKGMKKRLSSIMDTAPKKAGTMIVCFAVFSIMTSGLFIACNRPETQGGAPAEPGLQNNTDIERQELPEKFDIRYISELEQGHHTTDLDPELVFFEACHSSFSENEYVSSDFSQIINEDTMKAYQSADGLLQIIVTAYPIETSHGDTLNVWDAKLYEISGNNKNGSAVTIMGADYKTEAGFLNCVEGVYFQATAYKAAKAYLNGDVAELDKYLSDSYTLEEYVKDFDLFKNVDFMVLKWTFDSVEAEDRLRADYQFGLKDEDSVSYVSMHLVNVDGEWKVDAIGLEK